MLEYHYNTPEENKKIAQVLDHFIVSLTDGETHFDVSFSIVEKVNTDRFVYQSGIGTQNRSLLIAINYHSSFVFSLDSGNTNARYVSDKLNIDSDDREIAEQITDIINVFKSKISIRSL